MRCAKCGATKNLQRHHIAKVEYFGKDADNWPTIIFCASCHEELHEHEEMGQDISVNSNEFFDKLFGVGVVREPIPCVVLES